MKILSTTILLFLLTACGAGSNLDKEEECEDKVLAPPQASVTCLGDSETSGWIAGANAPSYALSWCNKLQATMLDGKYSPAPYKVLSVNNLAAPSKDIVQIYNEQLPKALAAPTQAIVIMTGVNDAYHNVALEEFRQKYVSIISLVKAKGMKPYCLTAIPTGLESINVVPYNQITLTMAEHGCTIIDVAGMYETGWHSVVGDIHPSAVAYEKIALALLLKL